MARRAQTIEEANFRFPTSVKWGAGYFGDGMRYIVAGSLEDAISALPAKAGLDISNLQRLVCGKWIFADDKTPFEVKPFGRDALGNYTGYVVTRGTGWTKVILGQFVGDIYVDGSFVKAQRDAIKLCDHANKELEK